ncbi:potassium channel family protein [Methylocaldum sp.]|uniref:potassium channel family protein n=1 Tax=Methylocaldum sp. TaxID=1969727 RepID=UPI002D623D80|nr:NAD-binding protein [Methylocaldum sp.]HYE34777.1 NAD-binding protein [Methylocaldum sp.]
MNPNPVNTAFFVALRHMRAPLIVLIAIFAISVGGLVLIPGIDAQGNPWRMDFFHALYFISYTATTIGFGEIPRTFTDAQRLWVIFCIFLSVIGWAYAIGKLLAVVQDRGFSQALTGQRFERSVKRLGEPFYLICGYGETGQLLARSLDHLNIRFVVIDIDPERINELDLQDYLSDAPGLVGDARLPNNLIMAGLTHRTCVGVIALTNDDSANLAVAIAVRLLNPAIPALCRATAVNVAANMASFGTRHIIDPFDKFGEYLALAIRSPGSYQLLEWLTGLPGTELVAEREPPRGHWLVCGYGRFGQAIIRHIEHENLDVTLIDPRPSDRGTPWRWVVGEGTRAETLSEAGIDRAVGIIAGTDNDINNLAIVVTARELNPDLFVVLRQNLQANRELFRAFNSDFTVVPSEIIAHECLAILTTPLLSRFLAIVKHKDDAWADSVVARISAATGTLVPATWSVTLDRQQAPAVVEMIHRFAITLDALLRDSADRDRRMSCVPLMVVRGAEEVEIPAPEFVLREDDRILFAGLSSVVPHQQSILRNPDVLHYVLFGTEVANSWVWRKLAGAKARP